ncbi:hypothetical protein [Thermomonas carbonis]|uniref:Uncharacterized protein n=1 Tax=Thermomonas carbonis TaxID=1463158 RepID=A0A7G9ST52_9GAMM|nr:hypothetical protein [Thermomonas carbonis]QNN71027.1 hypothetical protein H9L16_05480 [Thermomonas carbonis]GHC04034.1 hypothetical protein GCM10010080_17950 [Thermomonas carbonis]
MHQQELDALFDPQAAGYDAQRVRMAPIRESLPFLLETVFADLPEDARVRSATASSTVARSMPAYSTRCRTMPASMRRCVSTRRG